MKQKIVTKEVASLSSSLTCQESILWYFVSESSTSVYMPGEKKVNDHVAFICLLFDVLMFNRGLKIQITLSLETDIPLTRLLNSLLITFGY